MEMFNFVLDSFKRGIFDFKVKRQDLIAGTVISNIKRKSGVNSKPLTLSLWRVKKYDSSGVSTNLYYIYNSYLNWSKNLKKIPHNTL